MNDPRGLQFLRLNPRELEDAVREERRKWRIFRLQQVREQARREAERVRGATCETQAQVVQSLKQETFKKWQEEKENKIQQLQYEYDRCFQAYGKAHDEAKEQPDAVDVLSQNMKVNKQKAARRGREARKAYVEENSKKNCGKTLRLQWQQFVLRKEKQRANRVAHLPTPEAFKKKKVIIHEPAPSVQFYEHGTLTTTSYVPKNIVEKEIMSTKPSARQLAEAEEMARVSSKEDERMEAEDFEKKREERGRVALNRERLHRDYRHMIDQLDQAQISRHLTAFMQGADTCMHEIAESRLQKQASQQRYMEAAVAKILKEKEAFVSVDDTLCKEDAGQESDLKEISLDSKVASPKTLSAREREFNDLRDTIKKTRYHNMQVTGGSLDSTAKRDLVSASDREISSRPELGCTETSRQAKSIHDRNLLDALQPDYKDEGSKEMQDESSVPSEPETSHSVYVNNNGAHELRQLDIKSDIHFAETVPVHLISEVRDHEELLHHRISRVRDHRELPAQDSILSQSSSEGTILPASSDDIEVRIHLSSDSTLSTVDIPLPEDQFMRPALSVQANRLSKQYPLETQSSAGESTEYLSLPSSLPRGKHNLDHNENLKKIQEQRQNIQRLLDGRGHAGNPEKISPMTYMQEMNAEGNGKRPARKREKFEQKKREILNHYIRKLVNLKEDEFLQISASTVESSGINVSSLNALVDSFIRVGDGSTISSISCLTNTSSPFYPDIDEVPTKLSRSPACFVDPDTLHSIPRAYSHYDPQAYCSASRENNSRSSTYQELGKGVILPHHVCNQNFCTRGKYKMNSAELSSVPNFQPDLQDIHEQNLGKSAPLEASNSTNSDGSDVKSDNPDFTKELHILKELQGQQKLKQNLLLKKNNLMKECGKSCSPHEYRKAITVAQEPRKGPQIDETKLISNNPKELVFHHIDSDLADDSSWNLGTISSSGKTSVSQVKVLTEVPELESQPNSLWRNIPHESDVNAYADQFVTLNPESCDMSSSCSSKFSGPGKFLHVKSFTRTEFKHLHPETTLFSEGVIQNIQPCSNTSSTTFTSPVLKYKDRVEGVCVVTHSEDNTLDNLGSDPVSSLNNINEVKRDVHSYKTKSVASEKYDPSPLVRKRLPSHDIIANQTLTSLRDVSSEVPADRCSRQLSVIQQNDTNKAESRKSPIDPVSSQRSSSESVNSIPDMSKILQRFGLTWAKSMIQKMDKTEENSSSGN